MVRVLVGLLFGGTITVSGAAVTVAVVHAVLKSNLLGVVHAVAVVSVGAVVTVAVVTVAIVAVIAAVVAVVSATVVTVGADTPVALPVTALERALVVVRTALASALCVTATMFVALAVIFVGVAIVVVLSVAPLRLCRRGHDQRGRPDRHHQNVFCSFANHLSVLPDLASFHERFCVALTPRALKVPCQISGFTHFYRCMRSEEHTSELQSRQYLVCRLLLEKKKKIHKKIT